MCTCMCMHTPPTRISTHSSHSEDYRPKVTDLWEERWWWRQWLGTQLQQRRVRNEYHILLALS